MFALRFDDPQTNFTSLVATSLCDVQPVPLVTAEDAAAVSLKLKYESLGSATLAK